MMAASERDVQIRAGGVELVDGLAPLWKSLHEHHATVASSLGALWTFRTPDESWNVRRLEYQEWLQDDEKAFAVVAEQRGQVVGYAVVQIGSASATLHTGELVGKLESLNVLPGTRGAGVGRLLMAEVQHRLAVRGVRAIVTTVMTGNAGAMRFYERLGTVEFATTLIGPIAQT
jgi:ribosomal protein S18 acetylase RimI-like enzyme